MGHGWRTGVLVLLVLTLAVPLPALAHGSVKGLNVFFAGLLHPFLAPAHALSLVALALATGVQAETCRRWMIIALVVGVAAGALLAGTAEDPRTDPVLLALALCCSLMAALQWRAPTWFPVGVALTAGAAVGLGSGDPTLVGIPRTLLLAGSSISAVVLVAQLALWVNELVARQRWRPVLIAVRIVSSWMSAISILLLTLTLR